jgi:alkanesulfonate monooxygenase SsuD/methylene tetrahydromethanopterin reductase-like flavin-dependent oxidoreductase (luciferase family)
VSREKSIEKAASRIVPIYSSDLNPDGVIFHMKTPGELKRSIYLVKESLRKSKRKYSEFETVAIRLVYLTQDDDEWRKSAGLTLANYIANNEAYTESLERAGFREDVQNIKFEYNKEPNVKNLINAAKFVSDKMIHELTTHGSPEECAEELRVFGKKCGVKTVVAGLDAGHKDYYKPDFIKKLDELSNNLGS